MLSRIVAILTGLALLLGAWWMWERAGGKPEGEVLLSIVLAAPLVTTFPGDVGDPDLDSPTVSTCDQLPPVGRDLVPAPHWVATVQPDGIPATPACLLSGRWPLADLLGQDDESLRLVEEDGKLRLDFKPSLAWAAMPDRQEEAGLFLRVLAFDLLVRFPAAVESFTGDGLALGDTVYWTGYGWLPFGAEVSATSAVRPLAAQVAPGAVAAIAVVLVAVGALWPRQRLSSSAPDVTTKPPLAAQLPASVAVAGSPRAGVRRGPDPDSPWRPPG